MRVGFIGAGIMGRPMIDNLVAKGHEVRCYARSDASRERARSTGAEVTASVAAACKDAEVVVTMLPAGPDVLDVVTGEDGALQAMATGSILLEQSTISPDEARAVHEAAQAAGIRCLDAPVSGGEAGAVEGTLAVMVGGDTDVLDDVRPVLDAVATTVVHVGGPGAGQVVKAANQLVVAGNLQVLAEAMVFLRAHLADDDLPAALDVIGAGLAGSTALNRKRQALLTREHPAGFRVALHDKDMGIITTAARQAGLALPATAVVSSMLAALKARGGADLDHSALAQLAAELNGDPGRAR
ncbi:NAD(P)-binding domain-containing protein [Paenibacillus sp. TRM 82003]|nr:NAD(P)-binding domain-containing protein [Kineococcus sp. TRM81007]MCI3921788.1 NAD(P)-binding domain-containing protein [Paenibacillus sp. TRM 82003]